jgi:hypothetical protein
MNRNHRHLPPMTASELAELYDQNPLPVVCRLLWEIYRLRATVLRSNQIRHAIGTRVGRANTVGGIWDLFETDLDAEPCLTDPPTPRQLGQTYPGEPAGRVKRRLRSGG